MKKIIVTIGFAIAAMLFAPASASAAEVQVNNMATEEHAVDAKSEQVVVVIVFDDGTVVIVIA